MLNRTKILSAVAAFSVLGATAGFAADDPYSNYGQDDQTGQTQPQADQVQDQQNQAGQAQAGQNGQAQPGQNEQGQQNAQANAGRQYEQALEQIRQQPENAADKLFLLNAAIGSQCEVQLSRQVAQKSQNEDVKKLAQHIIADHEQLNQQLEQTAQQIGLTVPQGLPHMKQAELQIWDTLSGKELDQQYVAHLLVAHAAAVEAFKIESENAKSPQVKQFASAGLPKLEEHAKMTRHAANAVGLNAGQAEPAAAHIRGSTNGEGAQPPRPENEPQK